MVEALLVERNAQIREARAAGDSVDFARMLEGGEDVRFLARRLVILASEDIGNADPQALTVAVAAMQACEFVVGLSLALLVLNRLYVL